MAITKLLRIKESKQGSDPSAGLKRCIDYVLNPDKTDNLSLVYGNAGNSPDFIYSEMKSNKMLWGKTNGSQGFHYVISFSPDENVSHELALQIGIEFCHELFNGEHIYVVASHTDTGHAHCHIVFDSVNFRTGMKYHSGEYDWLSHIQPITDSICEKYGLSALSFDMSKERKSLYHKEWEDGKTHGEIKASPTWNDVIRDDIEECITAASDWSGFLKNLKALHYEYHDGKYLSLKPYGKEKYIRSIRLGPGYSKEELQERIGRPGTMAENKSRSYRTYGDSVPLYRSMHCYIRHGRSFSPQQRFFYKRYMKIAHIRNPKFRNAWKYKKEIPKLGSLAAQASYMFDHDITGIDDIKKRLLQLEKVRGNSAARERKICKGILQEFENSNSTDDISKAPDAFDAPLPDEISVYQVHLNRVLFREADFSNETFIARIPGSSEYIRLYSADSRKYNNGDSISTYIYSNADYEITDNAGNIIRRTTGEAAKERFKYRELKHIRTEKEPTTEEHKQWQNQNIQI